MKTYSFALAVVAVATMLSTSALAAQRECPPDVTTAEDMLKSTSLKMKTAPPSKSQAGTRGQDVQAPRGQDVQAPRGQDVQAPRGQDVQAPRAARGRTTALSNADRLVKEAQRACREGDNTRATANARAAIDLLTYLQ